MKDTSENLMAKFIEATRELREFIKNDDRGLISFSFSYTEHKGFTTLELLGWGKVDNDDFAVSLSVHGDYLADYSDGRGCLSVENIERAKNNLKTRIQEFWDNYEEKCEKYRRENEDAE